MGDIKKIFFKILARGFFIFIYFSAVVLGLKNVSEFFVMDEDMRVETYAVWFQYVVNYVRLVNLIFLSFNMFYIFFYDGFFYPRVSVVDFRDEIIDK